jgi:hypothetical protein
MERLIFLLASPLFFPHTRIFFSFFLSFILFFWFDKIHGNYRFFLFC